MSLRGVIGLLIAVMLAMVSIFPAQAELRFITRGKSNRIIVFVDSLTGDPAQTFRFGEGVPSWPEMMAIDLSSEKQQLALTRYDTALLSFAAMDKDQQTIPQLATRGLAELRSKGILDTYDSIVFIAYSAGGMVLKSMLIQSSMAGSTALTARTKVVFLVSVPAQGRSAADFLSLLASHQSLAANFGTIDVPVFLQGLESLWAEYLGSRGPTRPLQVFCTHETEATFGVAVRSGQYTAEGCDDSGEQPGTDHASIAKPSSRKAAIYTWVKGNLADYFLRHPSDPGKVAADAEVATLAPPAAPAAKAAGAFSPSPSPQPPQPGTAAPNPAELAAAAGTAGRAPASAGRLVANPPTQTARSSEGSASDPVSRRQGRSRASTAQSIFAPAPRSGDWTFVLKGQDCNLPSQLWVVRIEARRVRSDAWNAAIARDGKFVIENNTSCASELVRGQISGRLGVGWYLYADPCARLYCRTRFKMTWRQPQPTRR